MTGVAPAEGYSELEASYLDRAHAAVGGREVERVLVDHSRPETDAGRVLAGWWVAPDAPGTPVVLPNPWDDKAAVAVAEAHVWWLVGATVERIADAVEPRRSREEWHLILGPWLVHAASAVLDRLLFVRTAASVAPGVPVMAALRLDPPATMGDAVTSYQTDAGNRALIGALAGVLGLEVQQIEVPPVPTEARPERHRLRLREFARLGVMALEEACLSLARRAPTTLVGWAPLRPGDATRLAVSAGGLWLPPPWRRTTVLAPPPTDHRARAAVDFGGADASTPAGALWALLPQMLPRSVLEGAEELADAGRRRYGRPRHVIVNNYAADELQNSFLADCLAAGRNLTFAQHGGFYFQASLHAQERLERRPGSTYLSWGATGDGLVVAPSPRLARLRNRHRGGEQIVVVEGLVPHDAFVCRFSSLPLGNQTLEHDRRLIELMRSVAPATRARIAFKRFPASHLPDDEDRRAPELAALPHVGPVRSQSAVDWMTHAAVAVVSYPDTPFIEAMLIGVPTIGLWAAERWPMRDDAREAFERLERLGVIFDDPVAAAARLDEVADDPAAWWSGTEIQTARRAFLARFAAIPSRPLAPWSAHLRELRRRR